MRRIVTLFAAGLAAAVALALGGCASSDSINADPSGASAPAANEAPITSAASETPSQFVARFGKPKVAAGQNAVDCALGEVRLFASPLPTSFLPADGRLLPIQFNTALYSQMLTTYGGDGKSTFALPNLTAVTPNNMVYGVCHAGTFIGGHL